MMNTLWQDLRYGGRMLLKQPGFTLIAVLTLALGIGANTAIFSVVKSILLAALPYRDADRLVMLWENDTLEGNAHNSVAPGNFGDWRKQNEFCTELACYAQPESVNVTGQGEPERLVGIGVSANLFALLGVQPVMGRGFLPIGKTNDGRELILSHGLWQRRYGGDAGAIGKTLTFEGVPWTIVGVMPPQFQLPEEAEMWWQTLNGELTFRNRYFLRALGRLKPGVTIRQAQAGFTTIAQRLELQYPDTNKGRGIDVVSFRDQFAGDVRLALLVLFGAVGFVSSRPATSA
ncbi:MAG: ABC transporter permease [Blastocatellia bacterium]